MKFLGKKRLPPPTAEEGFCCAFTAAVIARTKKILSTSFMKAPWGWGRARGTPTDGSTVGAKAASCARLKSAPLYLESPSTALLISSLVLCEVSPSHDECLYLLNTPREELGWGCAMMRKARLVWLFIAAVSASTLPHSESSA